MGEGLAQLQERRSRQRPNHEALPGHQPLAHPHHPAVHGIRRPPLAHLPPGRGPRRPRPQGREVHLHHLLETGLLPATRGWRRDAEPNPRKQTSQTSQRKQRQPAGREPDPHLPDAPLLPGVQPGADPGLQGQAPSPGGDHRPRPNRAGRGHHRRDAQPAGDGVLRERQLRSPLPAGHRRDPRPQRWTAT